MHVVVKGCSLRDIFDELNKPCGQTVLHSQRIISRTGFLKKKIVSFSILLHFHSSTTNDIILVNTSINGERLGKIHIIILLYYVNLFDL